MQLTNSNTSKEDELRPYVIYNGGLVLFEEMLCESSQVNHDNRSSLGTRDQMKGGEGSWASRATCLNFNMPKPRGGPISVIIMCSSPTGDGDRCRATLRTSNLIRDVSHLPDSEPPKEATATPKALWLTSGA
jgi:hypothetical protein